MREVQNPTDGMFIPVKTKPAKRTFVTDMEITYPNGVRLRISPENFEHISRLIRLVWRCLAWPQHWTITCTTHPPICGWGSMACAAWYRTGCNATLCRARSLSSSTSAVTIWNYSTGNMGVLFSTISGWKVAPLSYRLTTTVMEHTDRFTGHNWWWWSKGSRWSMLWGENGTY